jgi:hypothetical protein
VPEPVRLTRATLAQLDRGRAKPGTEIEVHFNPDSLKVSYANQVIQPQTPGNPAEGATQWVGKGTTKLALQLVFDVTSAKDGDVRKATAKVIDLIKPGDPAELPPAKGTGGTDAKPQTVYPPPKVRFDWGTFRFEGIAESIEESLEYFSPDGRPLRSTIGLSLSTQEVSHLFGKAGAQPAGAPGDLPGTTPLAAVSAGATLQGMADAAGLGAQWQGIAEANAIENPRALAPGSLIDLRIG